MPSAPRIAIDLGGTKIAAGLIVDHVVAERAQIATPRADLAAGLIPAIAALVAPWLLRAPGAIGVATTGFASAGRVSAVNPTTLPFPDRFDLGGLLAARIGRAVHVVNDALAATWGEHVAGAGQGTASFGFLTISTGVGGGLVYDGRLLQGPEGFGGHLGHVSVATDGPVCGCGRRGCVEALASGTAISQAAERRTGTARDAAAVIDAAGDGDEDCAAVLDAAAAAVASLCANLKAAAGLQRMAIGGGVGLNPAFFARAAQAAASAPFRFRVDIVPAALGGDAGLIGMAALF